MNQGNTERRRGILAGLATGAALAVLAAFTGQVRAPDSLCWALVLLGGVAGAFRPLRTLWQWSTGALALAVALLVLTPALRGPLGSLTLAETPRKADVIVVLGAGVQCGSRTLAPDSLTRLLRGLELWRAGYAQTMTVSEQSNLLTPPSCPRLSALESAYVQALYPTGGPRLVTLHDVATTRDEAARVKTEAAARGWTRMLLVTSPSHSRRAASLFRATGLQVISVPAPELQYDATLPLPADRLAALRVVTYEQLSRLKALLGVHDH